ncbi:replication protein A 70 kDa DNA-binding subunit, partial [Ixodes scapularis]
KILIILELTVIANGADVGSKLGNPVMPSSTGAAAPSDGDGASNRTPASSEFAASVKPPGGAQFPTRNTQPAPMQSSFRSNGGPTSGGDVVVLPICSLTPYQN